MSDRDSHTPMTSRRAEERHEVRWAVDCASEDTFLYAYITNVSSLGLFVYTERPLAVGTRVKLSFAPLGARAFELVGEVAWINPQKPGGENPNPGMGIRFLDLCLEDRERLVEAIRTIAYVRGEDRPPIN
ncbi:MAG: TIGR02266 family protein [Deltaproteobacteria bacterium]|nr:TIGR02266 family protein [Deltaproteobacteria bacterium]